MAIFKKNIFRSLFFLDEKINNAKMEAIINQIQNDASFKELAIYICVSYIANVISNCEFKIFENKKEEKSILYYKLNVSPNPNQTASEFKTDIIFHYFYDGEALVIEKNNNLYCASNYYLDPHYVTGHKFSSILIGDDEVSKTYQMKDVFYFKLDDKDIKGLIENMYSTYGSALAYAISSYKRSNSEKLILDLENIQAGDPEFNKIYQEVIEKNIEKFMNNDRAIYPQYKGYKLKSFDGNQIQKGSNDITNLKKDIFDTVAQTFKIPNSMMYGNMTNIKDIITQFLTFVIDPVAKMIGEEITRKTYDFDKWSNGNYVWIDTSNITHNDLFEVAEKIEKLVTSGFNNIDEIRPKLGFYPLNNEFGKQHWLSKNIDKIENILKGGDKNAE